MPEKAFRLERYVEIKTFMEKKQQALNCYQQEKRAYPHPRSERAVQALAMKRGVEVYLGYAEACKVIRIVKKPR